MEGNPVETVVADGVGSRFVGINRFGFIKRFVNVLHVGDEPFGGDLTDPIFDGRDADAFEGIARRIRNRAFDRETGRGDSVCDRYLLFAAGAEARQAEQENQDFALSNPLD